MWPSEILLLLRGFFRWFTHLKLKKAIPRLKQKLELYIEINVKADE